MWRENHFDYGPAATNSFRRHSDGFNAALGDGHSRWINAGSPRPCMWTIQDDCSKAPR